VLGGAVRGHAGRSEGAGEREPEKERPVSEGTQGQQGAEDYSHSDSNTATVENDKTPKGPLAALLNLDILPSPQSETSTVESGDSGDYSGPGGGRG
jgi:hypothetical protein